jgi:hypothetical protein
MENSNSIEFSNRKISGGFEYNVFYHVLEGTLIVIGNNLDLVQAIRVRKNGLNKD